MRYQNILTTSKILPRTRYFVKDKARTTSSSVPRQCPRQAQDIRFGTKAVSELKVLLTLFLRVHGVQNGLPLGVVAAAKVLNFPFHLRVEAGHAVTELLIAEVLEIVEVTLHEAALLEPRHLHQIHVRG